MGQVGSSPDSELAQSGPEAPISASPESPVAEGSGAPAAVETVHEEGSVPTPAPLVLAPDDGTASVDLDEETARRRSPARGSGARVGRLPTDPLDDIVAVTMNPRSPGTPLPASADPLGWEALDLEPMDDAADTGPYRSTRAAGPPPPPAAIYDHPLDGLRAGPTGVRGYSPDPSRVPTPDRPELFYEVYEAPVLTPPPRRRASSSYGGGATTRDSLELILDGDGPGHTGHAHQPRTRSPVPPVYAQEYYAGGEPQWGPPERTYAPPADPIHVESLDTGYGAGPPNRLVPGAYQPASEGSSALALRGPPRGRPIAPAPPPPAPLAEGEWDDQPTELYEGRRVTPAPEAVRRATTSEALVVRPAAGAMEAFGEWVSGDFELVREISSQDMALQAPVPTLRDPDSLAANRYRRLGHLVEEAAATAYCRTVAITSPGTGDGKSVTALNLALILSEAPGRRVALLDCNLRRPALGRMIGLNDELGLTGMFQRQLTLVEALVHVTDRDLFILPAGGPHPNPSEVLRSPLFLAVLRRLEAEAHLLVVDTPALMPTADVSLLARMVDRLVVVVRAGHTRKQALADSLRDVDESKLLGVVLNEAEV